MNEDKITTMVGFVGLFFAILGAFKVIPIESSVLICGMATTLISYYVKK
jgi:hypothetical protein